MTTYDKIKKLCEKQGFAISAICEHVPNLNISRASISGWKKGSKPRPENLVLIAKYFNLPVSYFTDDSEEEQTGTVSQEAKVALFGGDGEVTDEMWNEVKQYAEYLKSRHKT